LVGLQSKIGKVIFHFLASELDVATGAEVSLEMLYSTSNIMESNECAFFFIKSVDLQAVLMKDDVIGPLILEDARINFIEQYFC